MDASNFGLLLRPAQQQSTTMPYFTGLMALYDEPFVVAVPKAHPLARRDALDPVWRVEAALDMAETAREKIAHSPAARACCGTMARFFGPPSAGIPAAFRQESVGLE